MIRVFLVDDHPVVSRGLAELLGQERDIEIAGLAASRTEATERILSLRPDVIVQDINLGEETGAHVIADVRAEWPEARFLVFTVLPENSYALDLIEAGAMGFLNKNAPMDEMVTAIRAVHRGKKYISQELRFLELDGASKEGIDALSKREREIFLRLAAGRRQVDIREELGMSHGTLSTYLARIHRKLGTRTTSDLVRFAAEQGIPGQ